MCHDIGQESSQDRSHAAEQTPVFVRGTHRPIDPRHLPQQAPHPEQSRNSFAPGIWVGNDVHCEAREQIRRVGLPDEPYSHGRIDPRGFGLRAHEHVGRNARHGDLTRIFIVSNSGSAPRADWSGDRQPDCNQFPSTPLPCMLFSPSRLPLCSERRKTGAKTVMRLQNRRKMPAFRHLEPDVTQLLLAWREGDEAALGRLTPLVHAELKRIAKRCMRGQPPDHTLQATAFVNEAYVRLVDVQQMNWQNRAHFLAMAARLMRRILVDSARTRGAHKRGARSGQSDVLRRARRHRRERPRPRGLWTHALQALAGLDERQSRVVELRFFGGLSVEETAAVLGISGETVARDWKLARAWLMREMKQHHDTP